MKAVFHADASKELSEIAKYYERKAGRLGLDFVGEVERVVSLLSQYPEIGAAWNRVPGVCRYGAFHLSSPYPR